MPVRGGKRVRRSKPLKAAASSSKRDRRAHEANMATIIKDIKAMHIETPASITSAQETAMATVGKDLMQLAVSEAPDALMKQALQADTPDKVFTIMAAASYRAAVNFKTAPTHVPGEAAAMQATIQEFVQDIGGIDRLGVTVEAGSSSEVVAANQDGHLTVADMALAIDEMGADLETMEKQAGADKERIVALEQQNAALEQRLQRNTDVEQRIAMLERRDVLLQRQNAMLQQEVAMLKGLMG